MEDSAKSQCRHDGQRCHHDGQTSEKNQPSPNLSSLPRYAIFNGSRYVFREAISHINDGDASIIVCLDESGSAKYATNKEWIEGASQFKEAADLSNIVTSDSGAAEKIALFRSLFRGRQDVYAHGYRRRDGGIGYTPACANEWKHGVCPKCTAPKARCTDCASRSLLPLDDRAILKHIKGASDTFKDVIAAYPIGRDGTTSFLVADFDKYDWCAAVAAYRDAARSFGIDVAVERSRSGEGGHVWIFFAEPIEAKLARNLGCTVITEAMRASQAVSFEAYDRLFPAQDTVPNGGFGNPIALPFQGKAQRAQNSIFVDDDFEPYADQWLHLSQIKKVSKQLAQSLVESSMTDPIGDLAGKKRTPQKQAELLQEDKPWAHRAPKPLDASDFPSLLEITHADMLYVPATDLSPAAIDAIRRLGAFSNPEFYRAQAMHQSVYNKPRIVYLGETRGDYIALPRGCANKLIPLIKRAGARFTLIDKRYSGRPLDIEFSGMLRDEQLEATKLLLAHDEGILSAPTGFGKTVVGAYLIAQVKLPTLVIVPRTALLEQWADRLKAFLDIREEPEVLLTPSGRPSKRKRPKIGIIGGGKNKPSGIVDIATFQSLVEKNADGSEGVKELVRNYGLVICDECHHAAAPQLERTLKTIPARKVYGLSATPKRADGLDQALFMLCGPIRCTVDPKEQARRQGFDRILVPRFTAMRFPELEPGTNFNQVLDKLCRHKARNILIVNDVARALDEEKTPLVITKRKAHARLLAQKLESAGHRVRLLVGEGTLRQRKERLTETIEASARERFAIIATESYLGEGFDLPRLDALFLATPTAWSGNVIQQSGRLHREYEGKQAVYVYDYVDASVPMLERMYKRRLKTYASLGYTSALEPSGDMAKEALFVDAKTFRKAFVRDIEAVSRSIKIFAPYVKLTCVDAILPALAQTAERGVRITCTICKAAPSDVENEPISEADAREAKNTKSDPIEAKNERLQSAVGKLKRAGCTVLFDASAPSGLAVFDEKIVWYGNLPLLAFPKHEDCSLRFESAEVAHEIMNTKRLGHT